MPSLKSALLILALLALGVANAAGPTDEEENIADVAMGRWPQQLSRDGEWIVYVNGQGQLMRHAATGTHALVQQIKVPRSTLLLSASRTAAKVALLNHEGCIGIATLTGDFKEPSLQWLPPKVIDPQAQDGLCPPSSFDDNPRAQVDRQYGSSAIGLSADGSRLAVKGPQSVRIIDLARQKVVQEIPVSDALFHLRFIDQDRKLLLVSAVLGEVWEGIGSPSDMQFSVWDLAKGELFQMHRTGPSSSLTGYDLQWNFSEATGLLWAVSTDGQRYSLETPGHPSKLLPIRPYAVRLKQCQAKAIRPLTIPVEDAVGPWLEFAADPLGRWVATVEPMTQGQKSASRLLIRNARQGELLASVPYGGELRSLTPSADGTTLYGMLSGQPQTKDFEMGRGAWNFVGGGEWARYDLPAKARQLPIEPDAAWPAQRCQLEDEEPSARDITVRQRSATPVFDVTLTDLRGAQDKALDKTPEKANNLPPTPTTCTSDRLIDYRNPRVKAWGQSLDGAIWVDRWAHLERLDPHTGRADAQVPTPRSASVCTLVSYARQQFLSWQGDTVTLRSFSAEQGLGARRVLAVKPGWIAESAAWLNDGQVGVRWIDPRRASAETGSHEPDGSALASVYRTNDKLPAPVLREVRGKVVEGRGWFQQEEGEVAEVGAFELTPDMLQRLEDEQRGASNATFVWERSHFGSVRARRRGVAGQPGAIALWDGLRARAGAGPGYVNPDVVVALGGSLGAVLSGENLSLYDASSRQRLTPLRQTGLAEAAWNERGHLLLLAYTGDGEETGKEHLRGLRLGD